MTDAPKATDDRELAAEVFGRDAHSHGVSIDGCRAYTDDPRIQRAWKRGWAASEDADRKRRGVPGMG